MSQPRNTLTYEGVLETFRETAEQMEKTGRMMKEAVLALEKKCEVEHKTCEEEQRKREKERKVWKKQHAHFMREWGDPHGDLIDKMVKCGLIERFRELGYIGSRIEYCRRERSFQNKELRIDNYLTFCLESNEFFVAIEIQRQLSLEHITDHIERVEEFRKYSDARNDNRRCVAGVGSKVVPDDVRNFALKQGLFVVQRVGNKLAVIPPEGEPRVWHPNKSQPIAVCQER